MGTATNNGPLIPVTYDDRSVRRFTIAACIWGLVGMLAGVIIAFQLNFWELNGQFLTGITSWLHHDLGLSFIPVLDQLGFAELTFGRLRPLHTNAAIFAFVGNMMFAGIYYSTQRLCRVRMASDKLSAFHFWGWQLIIVAAAVTLPLGLTQGGEYMELIWPIDIAVVLVWVAFAVNFFWTLAKRNEAGLYVSLWFYIATIITVALLYVVRNLALPTSFLHSYPLFGGVQEALVQWWYGHNAVAFFLTTPILGIMYYFVPKSVNRPVYSYRLSIIHFWALVFIYIWAGPHHLLNTPLDTWLQYLGMLFSLMLWAPSWGGMLNGLLTLRGAWDKLRTDPIVKFFAVAVTFYGMATFEGPLMSIRTINQVSHYTDWTIGHVHSGTLGWNGFMAAGMIYWLAPRLWRTKLWSTKMANFHFYIGTIGILLYVASMWVSGITQGTMLNEVRDGVLVNKFIDTLNAIKPAMLTRAIGGGFYLIGWGLLTFNIFKTIRSGKAEDESVEVINNRNHIQPMRGREVWLKDPVVYFIAFVFFMLLWWILPNYANLGALAIAIALAVQVVVLFKKYSVDWSMWHDRLLENALPFTILTFVAVAIGGSIQIIPNFIVNRAKNVEGRIQEVYTPLELAGRDIYVREGCYTCHSQMIRTIEPDALRYGVNGHGSSLIGESIYDFPFQWGSKRTGPDLAREGGAIVKDHKLMRSGIRSNVWHYDHFKNPRELDKDSVMPAYPWLFDNNFDLNVLPPRIATQVRLGVPYPPLGDDEIKAQARQQAREIATNLITSRVSVPNLDNKPDSIKIEELSKREIVALIAYVQKLGIARDVEQKQLQPQAPLKPSTPDIYRGNQAQAR